MIAVKRARKSSDSEDSIRAFMLLALPLIAASSLTILSSTVDTAIMGHYSTTGLASVALGASVADLCTNVLLGALMGYRVLLSRSVGNGNGPESRLLTRGALLFSLLAAGTIAIVMCFFSREIIFALSQSTVLAEEGEGYLIFRALALPVFMVLTIRLAVASAHRRTRVSLEAASTLVVTNLFLDWLLVFGVGPFPELGATGDGVATFLATVIATCVAYFRSSYFLNKDGIEEDSEAAVTQFPIRDFLKVTWPAVVSALADYASTVVLVAFVGRQGSEELAAAMLAWRLHEIVFLVISGFAAARIITLARLMGGEQDSARADRNTNLAILCVGILAGVMLAISSPFVGVLMSSDQSVVDESSNLFLIVAIAAVPMAASMSYVARMRARKRMQEDMWANVVSTWLVQLPAGIFLLYEFGIGAFFVSYPLGWLFRLIFSVIFERWALRREGHS
ncbi:MATE family efflux transporter [Nocardiopsis sp. NPDC006938]|uniref:MATE family efflux transporter n=1 Tax=Nocardiopsis sp. NPDC006938 TaxID=3364337 RepID=UPI0036C48BCF